MAESEETKKKVVWVLGAGFSAALGAPTLTQLLSPASANDMIVRYPPDRYRKLHIPIALGVRLLYEYGLANGLTRLSNGQELLCERMWTSAEDFLDYIDSEADAASREPERFFGARLNLILPQLHSPLAAIKEIRATARRLIAAECCGFLEDFSAEREKWRPFRRWARSLGSSDTVISFNYDRVVEKLRDAHDEDVKLAGGEFSNIHVRVPGEEQQEPKCLKHKSPFLKLHGSVDWRRRDLKNNEHVVEITTDPLFALTCADEELAIGTPGPSKQAAADELKPLWNLACRALENANSVVFLGYRFPETDAFARERLLGAISQNKRSFVPFHIILAHSDNDADRLASLIKYARRMGGRKDPSTETRHHRLFTQDFLTVFNRDDLFE